MESVNYGVSLWVLEGGNNEVERLLLHGYAVQSRQAPSDWNMGQVKPGCDLAGLKGRLSIKHLSAVKDQEGLDCLLEQLKSGCLDLSFSTQKNMRIQGSWTFREERELPTPVTPCSLQITNLAERGGVWRTTAWSWSLDPLSEFLQRLSPDNKDVKLIRMSQAYANILAQLKKETGLDFEGDDFISIGNFDFYRSVLAFDPGAYELDFNVLRRQLGNSHPISCGFEVILAPALCRVGAVQLTINLYGHFDRILSRLLRIDPRISNRISIENFDMTEVVSYSIDAFREDTGEFLTSVSNRLMKEIRINMRMNAQSRDIETIWSQKQLKTRPGKDLQNLTHIQLQATDMFSTIDVDANTTRKPWHLVSDKSRIVQSLFESHDIRLDLIPNISDITDQTRIEPLLELVNSGDYQKAELFDPYFDQASVQKMLLRLENTGQSWTIYTMENDPRKDKRLAHLMAFLDISAPVIPCRVSVKILRKPFHDRFLFLHTDDDIEAFCLTNSLDAWNRNYPLFILRLSPRQKKIAYRYYQSLIEPDAQYPEPIISLWDVSSSLQKVQLSPSEATDVCTTFTCPPQLECLLNNDGKVSPENTRKAIALLLGGRESIDWVQLSELSSHGIFNIDALNDVIVELLMDNKILRLELTDAIRQLHRTFRAKKPGELESEGILQQLGKAIERQHLDLFDLQKMVRLLDFFFNHPFYLDAPKPRHQICLWIWLGHADFSSMYALLIELKSIYGFKSILDCLIFRSKLHKSIVDLHLSLPGDQFLLALAMVVVTHSTPECLPSEENSSIENIKTWMSGHPRPLSPSLVTMASLATFCLSQKKSESNEEAFDFIADAAATFFPSLDQYDRVEKLIQNGAGNLHYDRIYELSQRFQRTGLQEWSERFDQALVKSFENLMASESQNFNLNLSIEGPLFNAVQCIASSWDTSKQTEWLQSLMPRRRILLLSAPFAQGRDHFAWSRTINQVGLWMLLRTGLARISQQGIAGTILDDFDKIMVPSVFKHHDGSGILKLLVHHLHKDTGDSHKPIWNLWTNMAGEYFCEWWDDALRASL